MDSLSLYVSSLNFEPFTQFSRFFNEYYFAAAAIGIALLVFLFKKPEKFNIIVISLILAYLLIGPLKDFMAVPRPCLADGIDLKVPCPLNPGMPSGHAAVSGIFLLASVGTALFIYVLPLALLISLSRNYLGVHTFVDVAGGIALGCAIYAVCESIVLKYRRAAE